MLIKFKVFYFPVWPSRGNDAVCGLNPHYTTSAAGGAHPCFPAPETRDAEVPTARGRGSGDDVDG